MAGCISASTVAAGAKRCSAGSTRPGHALGEKIFSTSALVDHRAGANHNVQGKSWWYHDVIDHFKAKIKILCKRCDEHTMQK